MIKRVAVLGGGGLLAYSIDKLFSKKYDVGNFSHYELDITDRKSYFLLDDYDVIINTAAFKDVDLCEKETEKAFKVNAEAPGELARYCNRKGKLFVHISTDYVFSGEMDRKYSEEDETSPVNTYGKSKMEGEKKILMATEKYIIARVAWLFGKGRLNFVDQLVKRLLNDETVKLVNDKWGNPTYTDSVAEGLMNLISLQQRGIFHLVNEGCTTRYDMAVYIKDILEIQSGKIVPVSKEGLNSIATRPMYTCLSTKKYTEATGKELENWRDVIEDYINGII